MYWLMILVGKEKKKRIYPSLGGANQVQQYRLCPPADARCTTSKRASEQDSTHGRGPLPPALRIKQVAARLVPITLARAETSAFPRSIQESFFLGGGALPTGPAL